MKKSIILCCIVSLFYGNIFSQNIIQGKVTDESNLPLAGASVYDANKLSIGTTTDYDGNFSLDVESLPITLMITYLGFSDELIEITSADTPLTVILREGFEIEEIIVSARKREENLKDVPISITAISGRKLEAISAQDITVAADLAPNVNFSYGGTSSGSSSAAVVYIRGVGQNDFVPTVDPGVGIYVDGVYLGRSVGAVLDLADVKRVEVLRGPQGTLFGRNTIGGAVSLTTNDPKDELGGNLKMTGGSNERFEVAGTLNIPFSSKLKSSITAMHKRRNGYVERILVGDDLGDENVFGAKANIVYEPTDGIKFKALFDYSAERESSAAEEQLSAEGVFPTILNGVLGDPDCLTPDCVQRSVSNKPFTTNETGPNRNDNDAYGASLTADFKLTDELSVKSISAYRDLKANFARASDGTRYDIFSTEDEYTQNQFSQELQLNGAYDAVDFVVGAYYFQEKGFNGVIVKANDLPIPVFPYDIGGDTDNTSMAGFGEATLHLMEKLHITGGLRYTTETKRYDPYAIDGLGRLNVNRGFRELDFSELTWRGILAYDITESVNAYASASKGFKSGGFDVRYTAPTADLGPTSFLPETVLSYEAGIKTYFRDAKLRMNLSVFLSDYDNIQVSVNPPGGVATRTINGAKAEMMGAEFDLDWSPFKNFIIDGSVGYIEAEYTELSTGSELSLEDEFIRTPTSSYNVGLSYLMDLGKAGTLTPRAVLTSQNEIHFEPVNNEFVFEDGYNNIDAFLTYKPSNGKLTFTAGVTNLTDERYLIAGDSNGTIGYAMGVFARPRNWLLSAKYDF